MHANFAFFRLIIVFIGFVSSAAMASSSDSQRSISVSGTCLRKISPDRGTLTLVAQVDDKAATGASERATELYEQIRKAVINLKLKDQELQTSEYNVTELCDYGANGKRVCKGFRASLGLQVVTSEINRLGEVMALGSKMAINRIEGLRTSLSREKMKEAHEACLVEAIKNAKEKADKMAIAAGARVGLVSSIDENIGGSTEGPQVYADAGMSKMELARSSSISTNVESKPEVISVMIQIKFQLN